MERRYIIALRKECRKAPKYLRARKAVRALKEFGQKHMKVEDVRIGKYVNLHLWEKGNRHPPHKIEVTAELITEKIDGKEHKYCKIELVGAPKEEKKVEEKKKLVDKLKETITGDKKAAKKETEGEKKEDEIKEAKKVIMKEEEKLLESKKAPKAGKSAKELNLESRPSEQDIRGPGVDAKRR